MIDRAVCLAAALACPLASAQVQYESDSFDLAPTAGALFAKSVAVEGDRLVAGAPTHAGSGADSGRAFVFSRATGQVVHELVASDAAPGRAFGASVAMDADRIAVGAPATFSLPAVYVFDAGTGQELLRIPYPGTVNDQSRFGTGLALDGGLLLVGAPKAGPGAIDGRVYTYDASTGALLHEMIGVNEDGFGTAVAMDQGLAAVTSETTLYALDPLQGQPLVPIYTAPGPVDLFGSALDVDGGLIALASAEGGTHALVFDATGQVRQDWSDQLLSPAGVALNGSVVVFGEIVSYATGPNDGLAQVFDLETGDNVQTLLPSDPTMYGNFGGSVALDGSVAVVGSPGWAPGFFTQDGKAYEYAVRSTGITAACYGLGCPCQNAGTGAGCTNAAGTGGDLTALGGASVSADSLRLVATGLTPNQFALAVMGGASADQPWGNGRLCVAPGAASGLYRFPARSSGSSGSILETGLVAYSAAQFDAGGQLTPGSTWVFQVLYRDTGGPCGATFNGTDALAITFGP